MASREALWKIASLYAKICSYDCSFDEKKAVMTYSYEFPGDVKPLTLTYTIYPNGRISVAMDYEPVEKMSELPDFGWIIKLPADYSNVDWYGMGLEENYCDRNRGAKLGYFHSTASGIVAHNRASVKVIIFFLLITFLQRKTQNVIFDWKLSVLDVAMLPNYYLLQYPFDQEKF